MHNFSGHDSIVNTLSINQDNVMVSGGDDGTLVFGIGLLDNHFNEWSQLPNLDHWKVKQVLIVVHLIVLVFDYLLVRLIRVSQFGEN